MLDRSRTVAEVVLDHSECAKVFQRHRIDFCCRGDLSIEAAAEGRGVDADALLSELAQAIAERRGAAQADPRELGTSQLIEHIVSKHHAYLRQALPFVTALASKVGRVHGSHNPKLIVLNEVVGALSDALMPHLEVEERELFPALTAEVTDREAAAELLAGMQEEHLEVAALLEQLRAASDDFSLPSWACTSYRTLFSELSQLESDIFTHVHLENHVLKPRFA